MNRLDVYYKDAGGFEATVISRYGVTQAPIAPLTGAWWANQTIW